jgi:hypothetical protein
MTRRSLIELLLCLVLAIATVGVAAANGPELMVYSGIIPQGVNQGDGPYEISFSIYASEQGGSALWKETQNVYVYQGTFAVYLGAVQKLNLAFDEPYWVGVKTGGKEDIWPLTGAGYPVSGSGAETSVVNAAITSQAVAADEVKSSNIKEADGTTGQDTNTGSGIKTNHIQNAAVTTAKIAAGAVTDAKIKGPISGSKISSTGLNADKLDGLDSTAYVKKSGATMTGPLDMNGNLIRLSDYGDSNYGLGYKANFAGQSVVGPVLYGFKGGALAASGPEVVALQWDGVGNIGIGTSPADQEKVRIGIAGSTSFPAALKITGSYGALGVGRSIVFGDSADYVRLRDVVEASAQVGFSIDTAGSQSRLYIKHDGNVGIGTTTPAQKLSVAGTIESTSGGVKFPDGTVQKTAGTPPWSQKLPCDTKANCPRFMTVLNGYGVLDKETGLVWAKAPGYLTGRIWEDALDYCYNLNLGGRAGWRLPSVEELRSLIDPNKKSPALPGGHPFTNVGSTDYWSSTVAFASGSTDYAWKVDIYDGKAGRCSKTGCTIQVWPVRSGQ